MGLVGTRASEAWAHFFAIAMYNWDNRDSGVCQWKYWRSCYDSSAEPIADPPNTAMPTWTESAPVQVDCSHNVRWMEQYSDNEAVDLNNRGTMQDWIVFYWNVWSDGANRFSVDELTDIWNRVDSSTETILDSNCDSVAGEPIDYICEIGETWGDLVDDVQGHYSEGKQNQFDVKGNSAGVDGTVY